MCRIHSLVMPSKKRRDKRKKSSESDLDISSKAGRFQESPKGPQGVSATQSISDVIRQSNSILYETPMKSVDPPPVFSSPETDLSPSISFVADDFFTSLNSECTPSGTPTRIMASTTNPVTPPVSTCMDNDPSTSNATIIQLLGRIDLRIASVETKLSKLDTLEKKVDHFDSELKKLWTHIDDRAKRAEEKVDKVEERVDEIQFASGVAQDKVSQMEKECDKLRDTVTYLQSQSMRNNLIFCNIPESPNEKPDETDTKLRAFLVDQLKIAQETVTAMKFERTHRIGQQIPEKVRKIVCKFNMFTDREMVRKERSKLFKTKFYIHEQFPYEIVEKRRTLVPKMKEAINSGKRAWISYDTLYIDGKRVNQE